MPLNIDLLQILLHMLNFVILAGGLSFLLFKPVRRFLEQRREQFAEAEKKNRESAEENERIRAEYERRMQMQIQKYQNEGKPPRKNGRIFPHNT